jgi:hypothetical protein
MSQRRYSDVHIATRLHDQLNRNVEQANTDQSNNESGLAVHTSQIDALQTQLAAALARITALENANQQ